MMDSSSLASESSDRQGGLLRPFSQNEDADDFENAKKNAEDDLLYRQARAAAEEAKLLTTSQLKSGRSSMVASSGTVYIQPKNFVKVTTSSQTTTIPVAVDPETEIDEDPASASSSSSSRRGGQKTFRSRGGGGGVERDREALRERDRKRREEEERRLLPERALAMLLSEFRDDAAKACRHAASLRERRASLEQRRVVARRCGRLAAHFVGQVENQQAAAVEEEDYERADKLRGVVRRYQDERAQQERAAERLRQETAASERKDEAVRRRTAECFSYVQRRLEAFRAEHEVVEREDEREVQARFAATARRLNEEQRVLDKERSTTDRDDRIVKDERDVIERNIEERSADVRAARNETIAKLDAVHDEIADLRERLAQKEAVKAYLTRDLDSHDQALAEIRKDYETQLDSVAREENTIRRVQSAHRVKYATLRTQKTAHEAEVKKHSDDLLAAEALVTDVRNEIDMAKRVEEMLLEVDKSFASSSANKKQNEDEDESEDERLENDVVRFEAAVAEAKSVAASAGDVVKNLRREIDTVDVRLPALEAEKNAAAASRDFKAAGRASKELNHLRVRRKKLIDDTERLVRAEEDLHELETELDCAKTRADERAREKGRATMARLARRLVDLQAKRRDLGQVVTVRIRGQGVVDARNRRATVASVAAFVLDQRADAIFEEGRAVEKRCLRSGDKNAADDGAVVEGVWDEILADAGYDLAEAKRTRGEIKDNQRDDKDDDDDDDDVAATSSPRAPRGKTNGATTTTTTSKADLVAELEDELRVAERSLEEAVRTEDYDAAVELEEEVNRVTHRLEKTREQMARLRRMLAEAEAALDEAVGKEDFDEADRLEGRVRYLKSQLPPPTPSSKKQTETKAENDEDKKEHVDRPQDPPIDKSKTEEEEKNDDDEVTKKEEVPETKDTGDDDDADGALNKSATVEGEDDGALNEERVDDIQSQ